MPVIAEERVKMSFMMSNYLYMIIKSFIQISTKIKSILSNGLYLNLGLI